LNISNVYALQGVTKIGIGNENENEMVLEMERLSN
jgi:hypothetical protein